MKSQNKSQKQSTKNSKLTKGKKLIKNKRFIVGAVIGVVLVASGIIAFVYNSYQNSVVKEGTLTKSYMGFFGGGEATIEYKVYGNKKIEWECSVSKSGYVESNSWCNVSEDDIKEAIRTSDSKMKEFLK